MQHFSIKNIILIKDLAHTGELTITETQKYYYYYLAITNNDN